MQGFRLLFHGDFHGNVGVSGLYLDVHQGGLAVCGGQRNVIPRFVQGVPGGGLGFHQVIPAQGKGLGYRHALRRGGQGGNQRILRKPDRAILPCDSFRGPHLKHRARQIAFLVHGALEFVAVSVRIRLKPG